MTERDPDPLYDALRERLADHGQEPPAPLWASIRAQLPPPVARPQLRRRRWSPALLLCLLLAVAGATSWQVWRTTRLGRTVNGRNEVAARSRNSRLQSAAASQAAVARPEFSAARKPDATDATAASVAKGSVAARSSFSATPTSAVKRPGAPAAALTVTASQKPASARLHTGPLATGLGVSGWALTVAPHSAAARKPRLSQLETLESQTKERQISGRRAHGERERGAVRQERGVLATAPAATAAGFARDAQSTQGVALPLATNAGSAAAKTATRTGAEPSLLKPLVATLQPLVFPGLNPALPGASLVAPPDLPSGRWSAQVLAGPALTHQSLGAAPRPAFTVDNFGNGFVPNSPARDEKPSAGFGVQALVRRVLTGRWSLGAGLGYQEYASQVTVRSVFSSAGPIPPRNAGQPFQVPATAEYRHRDTYRLLLVPVRVGYALGRPAGRLTYGVLAGADAALYLGGTSTNTRGQAERWSGSGGSPYRALGVALSAGVDLRCRVAPRLELLAQPTATHFVTSLPRTDAGLPTRYLWEAGVRAGVSYHLR